MEHYIVRIYRRDEERKIVGIVELVEAEDKKSFRSFDELERILAAPGDGKEGSKGKKIRNCILKKGGN